MLWSGSAALSFSSLTQSSSVHSILQFAGSENHKQNWRCHFNAFMFPLKIIQHNSFTTCELRRCLIGGTSGFCQCSIFSWFWENVGTRFKSSSATTPTKFQTPIKFCKLQSTIKWVIYRSPWSFRLINLVGTQTWRSN